MMKTRKNTTFGPLLRKSEKMTKSEGNRGFPLQRRFYLAFLPGNGPEKGPKSGQNRTFRCFQENGNIPLS